MRILIFSGIILSLSLINISCEDDIPSPEAIITATLNENIVRFTAEVTGGDKYEWDFGDGSEISTLVEPEHVYRNFGRDYIVTLKITGPGGISEFTYKVSIPEANHMQLLTGGAGSPEGKKWRMKEGDPIKIVRPDNSMFLVAEWPGITFTAIGFTGIYENEFQFFNTGDYAISLMTEGIPAGLHYCSSHGLENHAPSEDAAVKGLTLSTGNSLPDDLTFGLNELKDMSLSITYDGVQETTVTFSDVTTISFSRGAFMGIYDCHTECLVTELNETEITIALFLSDIPSGCPMTGKINKAILIKFVAVS